MLDGRTMPSSSLDEREVDKEIISLSVHAVSGGYCSGNFVSAWIEMIL